MDISKLKKEYEQEKKNLHNQGGMPVGVNSHLANIEAYIDWRKKHTDLFDRNDNAKDLI